MRSISPKETSCVTSQPIDPLTRRRRAFDQAICIEVRAFGESMADTRIANEIFERYSDHLTQDQIQKAFDNAIHKKSTGRIANSDLAISILREKINLLTDEQISRAFDIGIESTPFHIMQNSDLAQVILRYLHSSEKSALVEDRLQIAADRALEVIRHMAPQQLHEDHEFTRSAHTEFEENSESEETEETFEETEYTPSIEEFAVSIVEYFADFISDANLIEFFALTSDMELLRSIQHYVEENRENIELPARDDIEVGGAHHFGGIAFDIHTFAKNLDKRSIAYMKKMIEKDGFQLNPFTIENLIEQIKSSFPEGNTNRNLALSALNKIQRSSEYKKKLENLLPLIATFITHGKQLGLSGETTEENWALWLNQSFVESATAYDGDRDVTSCIPGIYERLFTGFQTMHPVLDLLFLPASLIKFYFPTEKWERDPKSEMLQKQAVLEHILTSLAASSQKIDRRFLNKIIKSCILDKIQAEFTQGAVEKISQAKPFLPEKYDIDEIVTRIWDGKLKSIEPQLDAFLNSLDNLDLYRGSKPTEPLIFTNWIQRMMSTLALMFQTPKMTDAEKIAAIKKVVAGNLKKIQDSQNLYLKLFDLDQEEKSGRIDVEFETLSTLRELLGDALKDEDGQWVNPFPTFLNENGVKEFSKNPDFRRAPQA